MKKKRVIHNPGVPVPDARTDWNYVKSMSDAEAERRANADKDAQPIGQDDLVADLKPTPRLKRWKH